MSQFDHELKTDPIAFGEILEGDKSVELRKDDRAFKVGNSLNLRETKWSRTQMNSLKPLEYTGREHHCHITHIQRGYGLSPGWVALSFKSM